MTIRRWFVWKGGLSSLSNGLCYRALTLWTQLETSLAFLEPTIQHNHLGASRYYCKKARNFNTFVTWPPVDSQPPWLFFKVVLLHPCYHTQPYIASHLFIFNGCCDHHTQASVYKVLSTCKKYNQNLDQTKWKTKTKSALSPHQRSWQINFPSINVLLGSYQIVPCKKANQLFTIPDPVYGATLRGEQA